VKIFLLIICLLIPSNSRSSTYFVAPDGSDTNEGTFDHPWLTFQKGFNNLSPGDTLFIRGGTYYPEGTISAGVIAGAASRGKKGTASRWYNVFAFPGEHPVLDCRKISDQSLNRAGIMLAGCAFWHIKGIEITRVDQLRGPPARIGQGLLIESGNNNLIELIRAHHCGGPGFRLRTSSEGNTFLNCDAYENFDPFSETPGDDADGFDLGYISVREGDERLNTLIGCRSWSNSDDGFDMFQARGYRGRYILENCWAWKNGFKPDGTERAGDGNGFKLGADNNYPADSIIRRSLLKCIACLNRQRGFSQESANTRMIFYNNVAFENGTWGFSFYYYDLPDTLRNNISYKNHHGQIENQGISRIHDHNSWDSGFVLSDNDFLSLDADQLSTGRNNDGTLPYIEFLHLRKGSLLVDAGIYVGLPYNGNAPDIGAFETNFDACGKGPQP
jgi:hypothetical protein